MDKVFLPSAAMFLSQKIYYQRLFLAFLLSGVCWGGFGTSFLSAQQQELALGPQPGVLLLKQGQVLEGKILKAGDYYLLSPQDTEGEIRIKTSEVQYHGQSLEDLFFWKRSRVKTPRVDDYLDWAQWCLQYRLIPHAEHELALAERIDREHPRLTLLRRRLELAMSPPSAPTDPSFATPQGPSNEDLDRLIRGLSPIILEKYTRTIQPLLLHNCATASCHGPLSQTPLQLDRSPLSRNSSRRSTQRNLHTLLDFIDFQEPTQSPLLVKGGQAHGKMKVAVFTSRDLVQYRELVQWVKGLARNGSIPDPNTEEATELSADETVNTDESAEDVSRQASLKSKTSTIRQVSFEEEESPSLSDDSSNKDAESSDLQESDEETNKDINASFLPKDPFDPAIFNRKYFPGR